MLPCSLFPFHYCVSRLIDSWHDFHIQNFLYYYFGYQIPQSFQTLSSSRHVWMQYYFHSCWWQRKITFQKWKLRITQCKYKVTTLLFLLFLCFVFTVTCIYCRWWSPPILGDGDCLLRFIKLVQFLSVISWSVSSTTFSWLPFFYRNPSSVPRHNP